MGILDDYMKQVNQIGIVVRNLDETARAMESFFGIKLYIISMPEAEAELRGRTVRFATKIGLARVGNVDLEFMEVVSGEHASKEFLDKHGPGINHLGIYVDDLDAALKAWTDSGGKLIQRVRHPSGIGTAFLDTERELGNVYIELVKL